MRLLLFEHRLVRYGVDEVGEWWRSYFSKGGWLRTEVWRVPQYVKEDFMSVTPSLDYLHGYNVRAVLVPEDDENGYQWGIEFHNGAIVYNKDAELSAPDETVVGLSLITTLYSASDTRLRLGRIETKQGEQVVVGEIMVTLSPGNYTIIDPRFEGVPYTPQTGNDDEAPLAEDDDEDDETIRERFNAARKQ